jgi:hypothetical protein
MQLYRIAKNCDLMQLLNEKEEKVESIKRWNVDGFSLVYTIANENDNHLIRNYFSDEEMSFLKTLSNIFLHLYYFQ